MPKYELILLDADDTLFDFKKAENLALNMAFKKFGINLTEEIKSRYKQINKKLWLEFEKGIIKKEYLQITRFQKVMDEFGLSGTGEAADFNAAYLDFLAECSDLNEGALEVCKELSKNHTLVIVTNGVASMQKKRIANSEIKPYIKHIIVSEDAGSQKPYAGFFEYTFKVCGWTNKETAIIIGDSLSVDIRGGIDFGIATCLYNPAGNLEMARENSGLDYDHEIRHLKELINILA